MELTQFFRCRRFFLAILLLGLIPWTTASAWAEGPRPGNRCLAFQKNMDDPALFETIQQRQLIPASAARTTYLSSSQKISQQTFIVGGGMEKLMQATVTCTGTCTGGCGVSGCDVTSSLDCSGCSCSGGLCTSCSCTKKSTVVTQN